MWNLFRRLSWVVFAGLAYSVVWRITPQDLGQALRIIENQRVPGDYSALSGQWSRAGAICGGAFRDHLKIKAMDGRLPAEDAGKASSKRRLLRWMRLQG